MELFSIIYSNGGKVSFCASQMLALPLPHARKIFKQAYLNCTPDQLISNCNALLNAFEPLKNELKQKETKRNKAALERAEKILTEFYTGVMKYAA